MMITALAPGAGPGSLKREIQVFSFPKSGLLPISFVYLIVFLFKGAFKPTYQPRNRAETESSIGALGACLGLSAEFLLGIGSGFGSPNQPSAGNFEP
jgi:hypothetical protein